MRFEWHEWQLWRERIELRRRTGLFSAPMATNLRAEIQAATEAFVAALFSAIASTPLSELVEASEGRGSAPARRAPSAKAAPPARSPAPRASAKGGRKGRGGRPSRAVDGQLSERVLSALRAKPEGLRTEQLRAELGVSKPELIPVLKAGIAAKQISKKGEKRLTTYFAR
jgi:hypothetical protein